jgi:4-aminobutyrate aminotransferase
MFKINESQLKLRPEIKVKPPGKLAKAIIDRDERVSSPSYIKEYPLVVDRGEGPWIYDVDGNRFLDFMAGIAVTSTGHAHPKVVKAIQDSAAKFLHICATDFYYESFAAMCEKLAGYVPQMGPKKVFLTNSGAEAVEGALKLARHHTKRNNIIAFKGAFHGRTMGAVSLTSSKVKQRAHFGPLLPGIVHVDYPNAYRGVSAPDFEADLFLRHVDPTEIAAIFIEPILGEGGYILPPASFLKQLRSICDQYGMLLVFDEIQCGAGRTGQMFAAEHFGVAPDVLLSAKGIASGMPLGAIIAKESVMTWPRGSHGSTYGGNPVCCAAGLATLEIVEELLPNVRDSGEYFLGELRKLQAKYPRIGDVRGVGFMIGVEFVEAGTRVPASEWVGKLEQLAFRKGLLLLSCGQSTIRMAPPLVVGKYEVDICISILEECLQELG